MDGLCGRCGSSAFGSLRHYSFSFQRKFLSWILLSFAFQFQEPFGRRCFVVSVAFCGAGPVIGGGLLVVPQPRVGDFASLSGPRWGAANRRAAPRSATHTCLRPGAHPSSASIRCASVPTRNQLLMTASRAELRRTPRRVAPGMPGSPGTSRRSAAEPALRLAILVKMSSALESALSSVPPVLFRYRARSAVGAEPEDSGE